ncbi:MAG: DMT family transporter [Hyphomicrobium sp.]|uniref:DMT family transporter n=1 Tax=Hyphomicrobium sp. TaxID=82 RepID=UPI001322D3F9|nr:DMT family transporter [Hyphomicrobium sp.]KAB2941058.1 MAG: EamA-like transporter family protein [Hyphomicrobium sp.]MBZ0210948.1 DMT family transporter [Hyphomicrobium sp.]
MDLVWALLGILSGMMIALQGPINAQLAQALGMPLAAAAANFVAGSVVLILITFVLARVQGVAIAWHMPPSWMFLAGGCLGAAFVTSALILTPKVGAAATMAFIVTGQLLAGLLLDRLGYFDLVVRELTLGRVTGAVLLVVGALLISTS